MKRITTKTMAARLAWRGEGNPPSVAEIAASVAALIGKHNNDANAAISTLLGEAAQNREANRLLKDKIKDLEGKVPGEGTIVLTKEQVPLWEAFNALGLKPEDVKKKLDAFGDLEKQVAASTRSKMLAEAAQTAGFKSSVLEKLADGLEIEIKDVPKTDDKGVTTNTRVAFVKTDQGLKTLGDYAGEAWKDFLPSLKEEANKGSQGNNNGVMYPNNGGGTGGGQGGGTDLVDEMIKQANELRSKGVNPLLPETGA